MKDLLLRRVSCDVTHLHHVSMATPHQHQLTAGRKSQCLCWYVTVQYTGRERLSAHVGNKKKSAFYEQK